MVKAGIAEFQAEGVFPSQSITHGISGLAIRQAFHKLGQRDQCQAPRGLGGLTMGGKEISKGLIGVESAKRITNCIRTFPRGNAARATRAVSSGTGGIGRDLSDMDTLLEEQATNRSLPLC